MMENLLSDEEGEKKGSGGGWTSFWPLSPFAKTRWGGLQRHCPQPSPGGWNWNMNLFLSGFFFFFLTLFCNKSGDSGEKDYNLFVPSIHPDKMDWITGVWLL